jgi:NADPH:quinone reductase
MRFIGASGPGGPEVLSIQEGPVPEPGAGEVLIHVAAAGVNRADTYQRRGRYPLQPGVSEVLGLEVAGTVAKVGAPAARPEEKAERWRVGDPVCALISGGGYAEYATAHASHCLPIPGGLSLEQAASLPEACFTVWFDIFQIGRLLPGQSLLVHGGSSGIGTAAIQMARALGSKVFVTAGSAAKVAACQALGATAINYRETDFEIDFQHEPMDVILDMVGGRYTDKNLRLLAQGGRLVFINFMEGSKSEVDLAPLMRKGAWITGSLLRPQPVEVKTRIAEELVARVWPLVTAGKIKPIIDRVFPLAEAAEAHRYMESSAHIGKILLSAV